MSKVFNAVGIVLMIGILVKMSIIGFYDSELPLILGVGAAGAVLIAVGQKLDGSW